MKLKVKPRVATEVNAKVLKLYLKVCDNFTASIHDGDDKQIWSQDDGYVPGFMPGEHHGDYVILNIDIDTGQVLNWKPNPEKLRQTIEGKSED